jgi:hypothetical protein
MTSVDSLRPKKSLSDWVKVYNDIMSAADCENYIRIFDIVDSMNKNVDVKESYRRCKMFTDLDKNPVLFEPFKIAMKIVLERYKKEMDTGALNFLTNLEAPNIIKYEPKDPSGLNEFHSHSDNWSMESSSRQLSIIIYLNDVQEGGETVFPDLDITIKPRQGSILVFPPFYNFTHKGNAPISGKKYIIATWIHYFGKGHSYRVHSL